MSSITTSSTAPLLINEAPPKSTFATPAPASLTMSNSPSSSPPPDYGKGDHSYAGYDLDLAAMISRPDLESIDPSHAQNRILISTNVKASTKYLQLLQKKQDAHNIPHRIRELWQ